METSHYLISINIDYPILPSSEILHVSCLPRRNVLQEKILSLSISMHSESFSSEEIDLSVVASYTSIGNKC